MLNFGAEGINCETLDARKWTIYSVYQKKTNNKLNSTSLIKYSWAFVHLHNFTQCFSVIWSKEKTLLIIDFLQYSIFKTTRADIYSTQKDKPLSSLSRAVLE